MSGGYWYGGGTTQSDEEKEAAEAAAELRRTLVHNEQVKLRATVLNIIAAGFVITGVIAPLTNVGTSFTPTTALSIESVAIFAIWINGAVILHYGASLVLRSLR